MHIRWRVPLTGFLVFGCAIAMLAQGPAPAAGTTAEQPPVQALIRSGANAIVVGDSTQARVAYNQLLAIGRERARLDLVWQAQHGLGRAALAEHDPLAAIDHLEQAVAAYEQLRAASPADSPRTGEAPRGGPYRTLTTALMMQSSSPVDPFVERAFDAAARARTDRPERLSARADITAAMHPGDLVVTYLVGDGDAYAWAFDRKTMIGYRLPPSAEIATLVEAVNAYRATTDRAGVQRIAEDLLPALLGPVQTRIPSLTRVIFVMDGPLRQLSIGELPIGDGPSSLSQRLAVSIVDDGSLLDEVRRTPSPPPPPSARPMIAPIASVVAVAILLVAGAVALKRRSSIP